MTSSFVKIAAQKVQPQQQLQVTATSVTGERRPSESNATQPRTRSTSNMLSASQSQLVAASQKSTNSQSTVPSRQVNAQAQTSAGQTFSTSSSKMAELLKPVRQRGASRQGSTAVAATSASSHARERDSTAIQNSSQNSVTGSV